MTGGDEQDEKPSWLNQTGTGNGAAPESGLDTSDWFESQLPPAAEQPEAANLRASDSDPETVAAHEGMGRSQSPIPPVPPLSQAIDEVRSAAPDPDAGQAGDRAGADAVEPDDLPPGYTPAPPAGR